MSRCGAAIAAILLAAARAQACEGEACDASALLQLGRGGEASLGHYSPAGQPCWSDGECFGDQPQGGPGTWVCGRYSANENYWQCCLIEYSEEHDGEMWCASPEGTACSEGLDLNCKSPLKCQPNVASSSGYTCSTHTFTTTTTTTTTAAPTTTTTTTEVTTTTPNLSICAGTNKVCGGDECCPGIERTGWKNFPCPTSSNIWKCERQYVECEGTSHHCWGNQCCPPAGGTGGKTFNCPIAAPGYDRCGFQSFPR
mmetsp:Transcript_38835/g.110090  ORF Transcript_38835/g.110090 Transcript_38835/m.110090 type:complete len:255 (+) Transcript_38835:69-833(+)